MTLEQQRLGILKTLVAKTANAMDYVTPNHMIEASVRAGPQDSTVVQFIAHLIAKDGKGYIEGKEIHDAFKVPLDILKAPGPGLFVTWANEQLRSLMDRYGVLCHELQVEKS